jgi:hypothetical protein
MIYTFYKDEKGYEKWLHDNKSGYVFNHFGTDEMNKMHHATCYTLHTSKHQGSRTNYEKICSIYYTLLEQEANRVTRNKWNRCRACNKI